MSAQSHLSRRWESLRFPPQFGGGSQTSTTTQKADPWEGQQPYLKDVFSKAQGLYNASGPEYYPGTTVAPMNDYQTSALDSMFNFGMAGGTPALNAAGSNIADTLNGTFLGQGNPYLADISQTVAAQVLPQIQSGFNSGNRLDSGLATRAAAQGLGDAISGMYYQNYANERQNQIKSQAFAPLYESAVLQDLNAGLQAGSAYQQQGQNELNDLVNRWNYDQNLDWNKLGNYSQLVQGNYGGTTTTQQPYYSNPTANILSGVTGLASMFMPFMSFL